MAQDKGSDFRKRTWSKSAQQQFNGYALSVLVFASILFILFRLLALRVDDSNNELAFWTNIGTDVIGVFLTVFFVDRFQAHRQREQLKKQLLIDVKYGTNDAAINAINRMRGYDDEYGWLKGENSLLTGANNLSEFFSRMFSDAKLQDAKLQSANLQAAIFHGTNLRRANLANVKLQNAELWYADLIEANCNGANMQKTDLYQANLRGANLSFTELEGANLHAANLREANLSDATPSVQTILPDGKNYDPEQGLEQMERFTNPQHSDFWDPCLEEHWPAIDYNVFEQPWYCNEEEE